ncbi:universal stress protein [Lichenifustis flavocetrariae]|uniref:Universal stress protein n=1 Tax=Lichenifustis flavocetrariae TaxID=2949735 RepID=A0AA41Z440_9HYPH|nr:universal stress protein [Lichenifustis flavocetrariae]MCW6512656.1 universal stress protein [Lichenifustis flavocetrariae]
MEVALNYACLMVPVDLGPTAADRVKLASHLAKTFGASLIGVAARQMMTPVSAERGPLDQSMLDAEQDRATADLEAAEILFRREIDPDAVATWRSAIASPVSFISDQASAADLLIVTRHGKRDGDAGLLGVGTGALLMGIGRPILVVPPNLDRVALDRMVIAWKNTREARRAIADALPLLKLAEAVVIASAGSETDRGSAEDVATYLSNHGIEASIRVEALDDSATETILTIVREERAGVLILGAYGHSRVREWMFGGVTGDLLQGTPVCCLMSH